MNPKNTKIAKGGKIKIGENYAAAAFLDLRQTYRVYAAYI